MCLCLEGECCGTSDGVVIRKGSATQTSASGVTYTGEWDNDKVCGAFKKIIIITIFKSNFSHMCTKAVKVSDSSDLLS